MTAPTQEAISAMTPTFRHRLTNALITNPLFILLVVMVVVVAFATGGTLLNWVNLRGILQDGAIIAIVAVPGAMLIIAGYIDLSVGSTLALGGVVAGVIMAGGHGSPLLAVLAAVGAGLAVGLVNAIASPVFGLSAFITTLGTLTAVRGVAQLVSPLGANNFGEAFGLLGVGTLLAVPIAVWIAGVILLLGALFLVFTPAGRHVYAIGVNRRAAHLSGVNVARMPFILYLVSGGAAGLAGAITVARLNSAPAGQLGLGFELTVLTAILLGGVALTGGEGNMFGVLVGVLFLGVLNNSLVQLGVTSFWQNVASGIALIAAIAIGVATHRLRLRLQAREAVRIAQREAVAVA